MSHEIFLSMIDNSYERNLAAKLDSPKLCELHDHYIERTGSGLSEAVPSINYIGRQLLTWLKIGRPVYGEIIYLLDKNLAWYI